MTIEQRADERDVVLVRTRELTDSGEVIDLDTVLARFGYTAQRLRSHPSYLEASA